MILSGDGSRFLFEALAVPFLDLLDSHNAAKAGVPSLPHFSHSSAASSIHLLSFRIYSAIPALIFPPGQKGESGQRVSTLNS